MIKNETMKNNKPKTVTLPNFLWDMLYEIAVEENHGSRSASLRNILQKIYEHRKKINPTKKESAENVP